jgi:hypothetical protein
MFTDVILCVHVVGIELNFNRLHDEMIHVPPSGGERAPVFCPKSMLTCLLLGLFITQRVVAVHSFYISVNFYQTTLCHTPQEITTDLCRNSTYAATRQSESH